MLGDPQQGTPSYSQGWGPEVDFTDRGEVSQVDQKVCVPFACYENVLAIKESNQSEPDAFQLKYFAPGIGNIMVDWTGEDQTKETLELVDILQLTPDQMTGVRAKALELKLRRNTATLPCPTVAPAFSAISNRWLENDTLTAPHRH